MPRKSPVARPRETDAERQRRYRARVHDKLERLNGYWLLEKRVRGFLIQEEKNLDRQVGLCRLDS